MRYVVAVAVLLSAVLSLQGIAYSQPPTKDNSQRPVGYKTSDCENKCTKDQQCMLHNEDEKYYCWTLKSTNGAAQRQMEVYIPCDAIGGVHRNKCSFKDITVNLVSGKNEIPVRTHAPGQCCISKSKLKIY